MNNTDEPIVTCEGMMLACVLVAGLVSAACMGIGSWILYSYHFEIRAFLMPAVDAAKTIYQAVCTLFL